LAEAVQRVQAGPSRKGRVVSPEERKRAAYHESGHAVLAAATGRAEDVHRLSILASGRQLGRSTILRDDDASLLTRSQLHSRIVMLMGGIAAEELAFGEASTGAEKDIEEATRLARDMAARFGMSSRLGRPRLLGA